MDDRRQLRGEVVSREMKIERGIWRREDGKVGKGEEEEGEGEAGGRTKGKRKQSAVQKVDPWGTSKAVIG